MIKNFLIFCIVIITLSLSACSIKQRSELKTGNLKTSDNKEIAIKTPIMEKMQKRIFTDFIYDVGPRFEPFKKTDIANARNIEDFIGMEDTKSIVTLKSVELIVIKNDRQTNIREIGYSKALTEAQLKLIQSFDYTSHFKIRVEYTKINKETGKLEDRFSSPHLTIVPDKQAYYLDGIDTLKTFLKDNSKAVRENVDAEKLQPAKLFFTVTKNGTIENVRLDRTSNYPLVDKKMIEIINKVPGTWKPAENYAGEKVDQELVVSFGLMGC